MADSHWLLISDHRNVVIQKVPHQRAQWSGLSPQSCHRARDEMKKSMLLLSAPTLRLHVPLIVFLLNQLSYGMHFMLQLKRNPNLSCSPQGPGGLAGLQFSTIILTFFPPPYDTLLPLLRTKTDCSVSAWALLIRWLAAICQPSRTLRWTGKIRVDSSDPGHGLFETIPSSMRLWSIRTKTSYHKNSLSRLQLTRTLSPKHEVNFLCENILGNKQFWFWLRW